MVIMKDLRTRIDPTVADSEPIPDSSVAAGCGTEKTPSMRRNCSWTLAGNSIYTASQWGILVAMAKLGTPEMVGMFGLALAITAPILMFLNLELRSVQATDARNEYRLGHYLGLRIVTSSLAVVTIAITAAISCRSVAAAAVVMAVGASKVVESISDVLYGFLQNRERMDRIAVSMVIKGLLGLTALSTTLYLTRDILTSILALAAAWAVVLALYDIPSTRRLLRSDNTLSSPAGDSMRPKWDRAILKKLAWLSLPLGCTMMLVSLNVNIPRYFIQGYFGERQLGLFVAVSYLMVAVSTIVNALGQAACPRLARYYSEEPHGRAFRSLLVKLSGLIAALSLFGVLVALFGGRQILTVIYRPEYAAGADLFVWVMAASGIGGVAVILRYGCISARRFAPQLSLWVIVVGANALSCLLLIPKYGINGAGMAIAASGLVQLVGNWLILLRAGRSNEGLGIET